jgi:hypothetical protein
METGITLTQVEGWAAELGALAGRIVPRQGRANEPPFALVGAAAGRPRPSP